MSKGRQTWDPETLKSTTCPKAFKSFVDILTRNGLPAPSTLFECFNFWFQLYERKSLIVREKRQRIILKKKYIKRLHTRTTVEEVKQYIVTKRIKGNDSCVQWLNDYTRSFCSYIKHAERGKKNRRAIASGSITMRMFLKIIEEFHLHLSKHLPGSTIAIGGEEKKRKIANELEQSELETRTANPITLQATEDATKWNECLNPLLFSQIHVILFDNNTRKELNLPLITEEEDLLKNLSCACFFFMLIKRIHLGMGYIYYDKGDYSRIKWSEVETNYLSSHNQKWFNKIKNLIDKEDYLTASPGFLMGMLNAASTTVGLIPILGFEQELTRVKSLRSSDDSMTSFTANGGDELIKLIKTIYNIYRLFGINPSKEKTIIFPPGYGEFTSWYQDQVFIGQCGVETSSLKPEGINLQDDLNSSISSTLNLMRTYTINAFGAISRIGIAINNCKRLWNVKPNPWLQEVNTEAIFIGDGGMNPWVIENLALDEATIRYHNISTEADRKYFMRVMNSQNPFSEAPEEELLFSKDIGTLVTAVRETPRNAFTFVKKSNRTNKTFMSEKDSIFEKANQEAFEIATNIDPSLLVKIPNSKTKLKDFLSSNLILSREEMNLTESEVKLIESAILTLQESASLNTEVEDLDFYDNL